MIDDELVEYLADRLAGAYGKYAAWTLEDEEWRQIIRVVLSDDVFVTYGKPAKADASASPGPPAWAEALASEWEAESLRLGDRYELRYTDDSREEKLGRADAYDACAEQLRERAKPG